MRLDGGSRRPNRRPHVTRQKKNTANLTADLEALHALSCGELKARWGEFFDAPCPARISRVFLTRALAFRIQERALGGLDRASIRRLERAAGDVAAGRPPATPKPKVKPGTRLLREWQGVVHEVMVLEDQVSYRGKLWPSLTAVAREITGARWSGPRFFGLSASKKAANGRG